MSNIRGYRENSDMLSCLCHPTGRLVINTAHSSIISTLISRLGRQQAPNSTQNKVEQQSHKSQNSTIKDWDL